MENLIKGIGIIGAVIILVIILSILFSFPLMWCWNYVMPYLFGFKTITWLQALALSVVSSLLIKSYNTK